MYDFTWQCLVKIFPWLRGGGHPGVGLLGHSRVYPWTEWVLPAGWLSGMATPAHPPGVQGYSPLHKDHALASEAFCRWQFQGGSCCGFYFLFLIANVFDYLFTSLLIIGPLILWMACLCPLPVSLLILLPFQLCCGVSVRTGESLFSAPHFKCPLVWCFQSWLVFAHAHLACLCLNQLSLRAYVSARSCEQHLTSGSLPFWPHSLCHLLEEFRVTTRIFTLLLPY